jgi:hypothetical protein
MYTTFSKTSVLIREHKPSEHSSETDCRQSSIPECRDYTPITTKLFKKKDKEKKLKILLSHTKLTTKALKSCSLQQIHNALNLLKRRKVSTGVVVVSTPAAVRHRFTRH